jgi:hypothetical protein
VDGEADRFPWTSCPSAVDPLQSIVGAPLSRRVTALGQHSEARQNCTHLFDLAGLAITHAARGTAEREYDITIPDRVDGLTTATLERDGDVLLQWDLRGATLTGPEPYAGVTLRGGFLAWAEANLDEETAEAAIVLRRACDISFGRSMDLDVYDRADDMREIMLGTCHSFQPGTIESALRIKGQTRDFSANPDALLA